MAAEVVERVAHLADVDDVEREVVEVAREPLSTSAITWWSEPMCSHTPPSPSQSVTRMPSAST